MNDTNSITLVARVVKDPELRSLANGNTVLSMRVAWNQSKKTANGYEDFPGFIDVSYFGKAAEAVAPYLTKGKQIAVNGRLQYREWESEGGRRSAFDVVAQNLQLLGSKDDQPVRTTAPQAQPVSNDNDTIPF